MLNKIFPFLTWLPIAKKTWKDDFIAGVTGTIIVIPQAVAFAIIAAPFVMLLAVIITGPVISEK